MANPNNPQHPGAGGGDGSSIYGSPTNFILRRSSYASVAAGANSTTAEPSHPSAAPGTSSSSSRPQPTREQRNRERLEQILGPSPFPPPFATGPAWERQPQSATEDLYGSSNQFYRRPETGMFGHYTGPGINRDEFFCPQYLLGTKYAERLRAEYDTKLANQRRNRSASIPGGSHSLASSASSTNLAQSHRSHRGLAQDVVENPPKSSHVEDPVAPLPTRWNHHDKNSGLEDIGGGLELRFVGQNKSHDEAAVARTDHPMPKMAGIYYFEVTILSKGKEGLLSIGFSTKTVVLTRLPGWEPESWAYHGDDGQVFNSNQHGKQYGPKYGNGDTIGCGINFRTGVCFYTRNGVNLGTAAKDITNDKLYPTVGMKKQHEHIRANFGQDPFLFDINSMFEAERVTIKGDISKADVSLLCPPFSENYLVQQLISQYLVHDGFIESAQLFAQEVNAEYAALQSASPGNVVGKTLEAQEDADATTRQRVRGAIHDGDIDLALQLCQQYYPTVLSKNQNLYFKLRCRKFIEMVRTRLGDNDRPRTRSKDKEPMRGYTSGYESLDPSTSGVFDHQMELDEPHMSNTSATNGSSGLAMDFEHAAPVTDHHLILYGQELGNEFKNASGLMRAELDTILGLMAYENPKTSTLKDLLEVNGRVAIAEDLNKAILVSQGKSSFAAIERVVQQSELLLRLLGDDGGPGAFVNLRADYLNPEGAESA